MKATFQIEHSSDYRAKVLIETGERPPSSRDMTVDVKDLRPDHRKRYLAGHLDDDHPTVRLCEGWFGGYWWKHDGPLDDPNTVLDLHTQFVLEKEAKEKAEREQRERELDARRAAREEGERVFQQQREERERKKADGIAALRTWGLDNGSELLRERIRGGFEFVPLAGKEYARSILSRLTIPTAEVPDEFLDRFSCVKSSERTTPELQEIRNLRVVLDSIERENLSEVASAELQWYTYHETYGDRDDIKRSEIVVTVTDPAGNEHDFYFLAI